MLILGDDYIKFCADLKHYVNLNLSFIPMSESKYFETYKDWHFPVARLDDIEIYFMHYVSQQEAEEKWIRRCARINWDNIIYKISEREAFTKDNMFEFAQLPLEHKIIFGQEKYSEDTIVIPNIHILEGDEVPCIEKYFDEVSYLNSLLKK